MIPSLLLAYAIAAVIATVGFAWGNFGERSRQKLLAPFLGWVVLAAVVALVVWTVLRCVECIGSSPDSVVLIPLCLLGNAIWGSIMALVLLPAHAALLSAYLRFGFPAEGTRIGPAAWVLIAAGLAAPAGAAIAFGYGWPIGGSDPFDFRGAVGPGGTAWLSTFTGLLLARRVFSGIRFGRFARDQEWRAAE